MLWLMCTVLLSVHLCVASSDSYCKWIEIDEPQQDREVKVVHTGVCREGLVTWIQPLGGIQLYLLEASKAATMNGNGVGANRLCLKVNAFKVKLKINIYKDGEVPMSLKVLDGFDKNANTTTNCVIAHGGVRVLLDSSYTPSPLFVGRVLVQFVSTPLPVLPAYSSDALWTHDCQPCSDKRVLEAYCSSQFAFVATFLKTDVADESLWQIVDTRRLSLMRYGLLRLLKSVPSLDRFTTNSGSTRRPEVSVAWWNYCSSRNIRPLQSGPQLVVMGTIINDRPHLLCATEVEQWHRVVQRLTPESPPVCLIPSLRDL